MAVEPSKAASTAPAVRPWGVAFVAGLVLGPLDLWGQVVTPYPWAHLFNSPVVWAAAAFTYGRWARRRVVAALGAAIVLVVAVETYYLADVIVRGADRGNLTSPTAMVWLLTGVVAGVCFGLAGAWAAQPSGWRAVLGRFVLPVAFGAEAVRNLVRVVREPADGRPDGLGQFAVLLAVLGVLALVAVHRVKPRS